MDNSKNIDMFLVGNFENANVHLGDGFITKSIHVEDFKDGFHDKEYKGQNYRFVNSNGLSDQSMDIFRKRADAVVFEGDLNGMFIEVTNGGIRSQYVSDLDSRQDEILTTDALEAS